MDWHEVGYSFRHNFPSYRLRHAIRMHRMRRKYPWWFDEEPQRDDTVRLPPSDDVHRSSRGLEEP